MLHIGLDVHAKHVSVCILDENGKRFKRTRLRSAAELVSELGRLPDRFQVCYEASCGYGVWSDLLQFVPHLARLVLESLIFCVHP